jgi:hypothetical protein
LRDRCFERGYESSGVEDSSYHLLKADLSHEISLLYGQTVLRPMQSLCISRSSKLHPAAVVREVSVLLQFGVLRCCAA